MIVKVLAVLLIALFLLTSAALAQAKGMTTYQRQVNLMKRVNDAQKKNLITAAQARKLRRDLSKIAVQKQQVRDNNASNRGSDNMSKVEEELNKASRKINKRISKNFEDRM